MVCRAARPAEAEPRISPGDHGVGDDPVSLDVPNGAGGLEPARPARRDGSLSADHRARTPVPAARGRRAGTDPGRRAGHRRRAVRRRLRACGGEHLVVSPGRLVWEKGHYDVIRALARCGGDARLLIVGSGPERSRLLRYAADLGLADRVEIRSVPYDEMPSVFARASCVVLASLPTPTWEEQFGLVLAEALAAGASDHCELLRGDPGGSSRLGRSALHAGRLARARPPARRRPARSAAG